MKTIYNVVIAGENFCKAFSSLEKAEAFKKEVLFIIDKQCKISSNNNEQDFRNYLYLNKKKIFNYITNLYNPLQFPDSIFNDYRNYNNLPSPLKLKSKLEEILEQYYTLNEQLEEVEKERKLFNKRNNLTFSIREKELMKQFIIHKNASVSIVETPFCGN